MAGGKWFRSQTGSNPYDQAAKRYAQMGDEDKIRSSAHDAGQHVATILKGHYVTSGQSDLMNAVQVFDSASNVHVGIHPASDLHDQAMIHEWGSPNSAPSGVMRTVAHQNTEQTRHIFMNSLGQK